MRLQRQFGLFTFWVSVKRARSLMLMYVLHSLCVMCAKNGTAGAHPPATEGTDPETDSSQFLFNALHLKVFTSSTSPYGRVLRMGSVYAHLYPTDPLFRSPPCTLTLIACEYSLSSQGLWVVPGLLWQTPPLLQKLLSMPSHLLSVAALYLSSSP